MPLCERCPAPQRRTTRRRPVHRRSPPATGHVVDADRASPLTTAAIATTSSSTIRSPRIEAPKCLICAVRHAESHTPAANTRILSQLVTLRFARATSPPGYVGPRASRRSGHQRHRQPAATADPSDQRDPAGGAVGGGPCRRHHQLADHPQRLGGAGAFGLRDHRGAHPDPVQPGLSGLRRGHPGAAVRHPGPADHRQALDAARPPTPRPGCWPCWRCRSRGRGIAAPQWHFDLGDRLDTQLSQFLDDPRWIALLAAVLTVSGPWLSRRLRRYWWTLLLAFVPIHLVVSAVVPARSLLGLAVGWFVGALVVLGGRHPGAGGAARRRGPGAGPARLRRLRARGDPPARARPAGAGGDRPGQHRRRRAVRTQPAQRRRAEPAVAQAPVAHRRDRAAARLDAPRRRAPRADGHRDRRPRAVQHLVGDGERPGPRLDVVRPQARPRGTAERRGRPGGRRLAGPAHAAPASDLARRPVLRARSPCTTAACSSAASPTPSTGPPTPSCNPISPSCW